MHCSGLNHGTAASRTVITADPCLLPIRIPTQALWEQTELSVTGSDPDLGSKTLPA